jgi:hypothetical protein
VTERPRSSRDAALAELLDRVLDTGASLGADLTLSVADVDLAYVSLRALLSSVETARGGRDLERGGGSVSARATNGKRTASETRGVEREANDSGDSRPAPQALGPAPRRTGVDALERFARRQAPGMKAREPGRRVPADPEAIEKGLAGLVLGLVDLLRQVMERLASRRVEAGTLTPEQVERLGETFAALERRIDELKESFGLEDDDLGFDLTLSIGDLEDQ